MEATQEVYSFNPNCSALALNNALSEKLIEAKAMINCLYGIDFESDETRPRQVDFQTCMLSLVQMLDEAGVISEAVCAKAKHDVPKENTAPGQPLDMIDDIGIRTERMANLLGLMGERYQGGDLVSCLALLGDQVAAIDGILYPEGEAQRLA